MTWRLLAHQLPKYLIDAQIAVSYDYTTNAPSNNLHDQHTLTPIESPAVPLNETMPKPRKMLDEVSFTTCQVVGKCPEVRSKESDRNNNPLRTKRSTRDV